MQSFLMNSFQKFNSIFKNNYAKLVVKIEKVKLAVQQDMITSLDLLMLNKNKTILQPQPAMANNRDFHTQNNLNQLYKLQNQCKSQILNITRYSLQGQNQKEQNKIEDIFDPAYVVQLEPKEDNEESNNEEEEDILIDKKKTLKYNETLNDIQYHTNKYIIEHEAEFDEILKKKVKIQKPKIDKDIELSDAFVKIKDHYNQLQRKAFLIKYKPNEDPRSNILGCKAFGLPYVKQGDQYPACEKCNLPMSSILQLNLSKMKKFLSQQSLFKLPNNGLIQLFLCVRGCGAENQYPFAKEGVKINFIEKPVLSKADLCEKIDFATDLPPNPQQDIKQWKETVDYPDFEEAHDLGVKLYLDEHCDILAQHKILANESDKLFGYPAMAHAKYYSDYPYCPDCDAQMQMFYQFSSMHNGPFDFEPQKYQGVGFLCMCPNHHKQMALLWQSQFDIWADAPKDAQYHIPKDWKQQAEHLFKKNLMQDPEFAESVKDDKFCCDYCTDFDQKQKDNPLDPRYTDWYDEEEQIEIH